MGTQTFGWGAEESEAHRMADRFVEAGGNLFDTSSTYNAGTSEAMLGRWLASRKHRDSYVIATKVFFPTGGGPNDEGLSRKHILRSVEESLRRLHTDYIDLYQAHCYDRATPIEETLSAFDQLVRQGKARYLGASNFTASELVRTLFTAPRSTRPAFVSLQAEYSLLVRETEWELLRVCSEEGLGLLAWSPLAGGWLTGKYAQGRAPDPASRVGSGDRWDDRPEQRASERTWHIVDTLSVVARRSGKTPAQVALAYLLEKSELVVPIFGARNLGQLEENLGAADWRLADDDRRALDEASELTLPYPYRFIERYSRSRAPATSRANGS